jgi:excisionase family DNA binding protein
MARVEGGQFEPTVLLIAETTQLAAVTQPNLSLAEPLLKPSEAANLLAVRTSWIYEAVRAGTLPCLKIGRHIRFTRPMLEDWLATRTVDVRL